MKRAFLAIVACTALVMPGITGHAAAAAPMQKERGSVYVATWENCTFTQSVLQNSVREGGVAGFTFAVKRATRGKPFILYPVGGPVADLDITFYGSGVKTFRSSDFAVERGRVPVGSRSAIVCLYLGPPTDFVYSAG